MGRGGYRKGSGGKPKWIHGKTKTIRVPEVLADRIIEIAHMLDEGKVIDDVTRSKYLDLSGIPIRNFNGKIIVFVDDLLKQGFKIRPIKLVDRIRRQMDING